MNNKIRLESCVYMNKVRLKLSPPWVTYVNKLEALFDPDPMIAFNVDFTGKNGPSVVITVGGKGDKATAIRNLLPCEKQFGNVTLTIRIDGNISNRAFTSSKELFETAFENNPVFSYVVVPEGEYWYPSATYVVFKNCVVQFFNDNLNDCHGLLSILYEDIASEIFTESLKDTVFFNTDIEVGKLGKSPNVWL